MNRVVPAFSHMRTETAHGKHSAGRNTVPPLSASASVPKPRNFETFTTKLETPSCNFRFTKLFQSANKLHEDLAKAQHSQPKRSFALGLLFHSVLSQSTVADFTSDKAAGFPTAVRQAGSFLYGLTTHKRAALADSRFKH